VSRHRTAAPRSRHRTPPRIIRNRIIAGALVLGLVTLIASAFGLFDRPSDSTSAANATTGVTASATGSPSATPTNAPSEASPTPTPAAALNVYAGATADKLSETVKGHRPLVYVPNTISNSVQVIDPTTYQVIDSFPTGREPHHVVPGWDLTTLYVNDTQGNDLIPIDPVTGKPGAKIPVVDPYNLYFSPDGKFGLVMAERFNRIDVVDPHTFAVDHSLPVPCAGVNHADTDKDRGFFVASCEFSGHLIVFDAHATKVLKEIDLNGHDTPGATSPQEAYHSGGAKANLRKGASAMPQDVRLSPNGKYFLAADMLRNGVWVIDAASLEFTKFIQTGKGAHSIYPSRDAKRLFVANRDEGTISVLDSESLDILAKWTIPGGGSPDMGGVTADGKELWLSGRYHAEVYVFDTETGGLKHRIKTQAGSHGLLVWPQPGTFSLGHTGNMR
jgi:YVTN family beta-propeller protein